MGKPTAIMQDLKLCVQPSSLRLNFWWKLLKYSGDSEEHGEAYGLSPQGLRLYLQK